MDPKSLLSQELFTRMSAGDEGAFREMVEYYNKQLLPLTISLVKSEATARDIMQEVFLKLWINREDLVVVENPEGWIRVVLSRTTSNFVKAELRQDVKIRNMRENQKYKEESLLEELDTRFVQSMINEAVNRLSDRKKEVYLLSRREGLSRKEIASQLNISENTVRNQLSDAMASIQSYLRRKGSFIIPVIILAFF